MKSFELNAEPRTAHGRAQNRRLRHQGRVPAILYGGGGEPAMLSIDSNELDRHLDNEAFYSHVIKVKIKGGGSEEVVLRALQRHPARPFILHMDLLRIVAGEALRMNIPLHFTGQEKAPGVVDEGGVFQHNMNDVEIECLPRNLPEYIEVDCSQMVLHDAIHLSQLTMPEGVQIVELMHEDEEAVDRTVVSVQLPRAAIELEQEEAEEAAAAEMAADIEDEDGDDSEEAEGDDKDGEEDK